MTDKKFCCGCSKPLSSKPLELHDKPGTEWTKLPKRFQVDLITFDYTTSIDDLMKNGLK